MINYCNKRHRVLLRYEKLLNHQNTFLFLEDKKLYSELTEYELVLRNSILWNMRKEFFKLFRQFKKKHLYCQQFVDQFEELWIIYQHEVESYTPSSKKLKDFQPKENIVNLSETLTWVYNISDEFPFKWVFFEEDPTIKQKDVKTSEKEICEAVRITLPKIAATIETITNGDY